MSENNSDTEELLDDDWGLVHPEDPSKVLDQAKLDITNMKPVTKKAESMSNEEIMRDAIKSGEKAIRRIERVQEHIRENIEGERSENNEQVVAERKDVFIRAYADLVGASVALQMTGPSELVNDINEAKNEVRDMIEDTESSSNSE